MIAHRVDSRAIVARSLSHDVAERVSSFLEKQAAKFPDLVSADMPGFYLGGMNRTGRERNNQDEPKHAAQVQNLCGVPLARGVFGVFACGTDVIQENH